MRVCAKHGDGGKKGRSVRSGVSSIYVEVESRWGGRMVAQLLDVRIEVATLEDLRPLRLDRLGELILSSLAGLQGVRDGDSHIIVHTLLSEEPNWLKSCSNACCCDMRVN